MIRLFRYIPVLAGVAALATACATSRPAELADQTPPPPRIALAEVGDSVVYLERTLTFTSFVRPGDDTAVVSARHDAVIHVMRTAPDTLEAFYEHLLLRFEGPGQTRSLDTDSVLWRRFVLAEHDGRTETVTTPELPAEIRAMTDLRRQFDDFFLRLPARPLEIGTEWVDTIRFSGTEAGSAERLAVARYRVRGDTTLHGIAARVIDYESAIETSMRTEPTTRGTMTSTLVGGEEGIFVFAPAREVMLARRYFGVLEGELVVEGNLETIRMPQSYSYESSIELLPPAQAPAARPAADAPAVP